MNKIFAILICIVLTAAGSAQPPSSTGIDILRAVCPDGTGGVYVAGHSSHPGTDMVAAIVARLDQDGHPAWTQILDLEFWDQWDAVAPMPDGGCVVAGATGTTRRGDFDVLLARYEEDGTEQWSITVATAEDWEAVSAVVVADDGTIWVGGSVAVDSIGDYDFLLSCFDADGTQLWSRHYGDEDDTEVTFDIVVHASGAVLCGYRSDLQENVRNVAVMATDVSGQPLWYSILESPLPAEGRAILALQNGDYAIAGRCYNDPESEQSDGLLLRIDSSGNELWRRGYGSPQSEHFDAIAIGTDGSFLLAGTRHTGNGYGTQGWLIVTEADGAFVAAGEYGGAGSEEFLGITVPDEERRVAVGLSSSSPSQLTDFYYLDSLEATITGANRFVLPNQFALRAWPNPFNSQLAVRVELPVASPLQVQVYDILGREVVTLVHASLISAGTHQFSFSASDNASGVYFVLAHGSGIERVQRVTLVK